MLKFRYAIFALLLWATPFVAYAQNANQVPNLATFRANAYGGTVWLAGYVTPGDGGQGYFLPNGKQSVTHCVDNGTTVIVDKNGTCWDRQSWGGVPVGTPSMITVPTIAALENIGASAGINVTAAYVPGIGIYQWNATSTATPDPSDTPQTIVQVTGVTTGRMILDPGPLALASITTMENLPGPVAGMVVTVAGSQGGQFAALTVASCTTDHGTVFCSATVPTIEWQRIPAVPYLTPLMFGAVGDDNPVAGTGTNDCVALGYASAAGKTYGLPVNLAGHAYRYDYNASTCPTLSSDPAYTSFEGPGALDFEHWTVAETGLAAITLKTSWPTYNTVGAQQVTHPWKNITIWGPDSSTGVIGIDMASYTPASPASSIAIQFDRIGMIGFNVGYREESGNWGVTWNSPVNETVGGQTAHIFLQLDESTGIERNVVNNPVLTFGNTGDTLVDDLGLGGYSDTYFNGGSLDGFDSLYTGDNGTGPDTADAIGCIFINNSHIESLLGNKHVLRIGNGGCAVLSNIGNLSFVGGAPATVPFALNNSASGDGGIRLDDVHAGAFPGNWGLSIDGNGPVSVSNIFTSGNASALPAITSVNSNLIPDWTLSDANCDLSSPPSPGLPIWIVSGAGSVTCDTTAPGASGDLPAGVHSFKLDGTAGAANLQAIVPCSPGAMATGLFSYKSSGLTAGVGFTYRVAYEDRALNWVGSHNLSGTITTNPAGWTQVNNVVQNDGTSAVSGANGTTYCSIDFTQQSGAAQTWISLPGLFNEGTK